ncbi:hypothetical protein DBR47_07470 [Paucibacter sp. KBW04]|uniref:poly-gamma-glutamate hydrolase family protein n=1 Tax=Paucibacter sp. KBW04 TaxID=2153361 RepID=UPI000F58197D|nr:poly-gamma-glutamate hydrolase family protein [Paucibacter sp. KBW04]RQO61317.1 hypothetical protein DBR47_07470 [Paucibacter sp. KBW04]
MDSPPARAQNFKSFIDLDATYKEGVDYGSAISRRNPLQIAVVAPHGGAIERPTSQIAADIARDDFSCYLFECTRKAKNYAALHLTSEHFGELRCPELIAGCDRVVAVYGCEGDEIAVILDRPDDELAVLVADALASEEVVAKQSGYQFLGTKSSIIGKRGRSGARAQRELAAALRNSPATIARVVRAVRGVFLRFVDPGNAPRATGESQLHR